MNEAKRGSAGGAPGEPLPPLEVHHPLRRTAGGDCGVPPRLRLLILRPPVAA